MKNYPMSFWLFAMLGGIAWNGWITAVLMWRGQAPFSSTVVLISSMGLLWWVALVKVTAWGCERAQCAVSSLPQTRGQRDVPNGVVCLVADCVVPQHTSPSSLNHCADCSCIWGIGSEVPMLCSHSGCKTQLFTVMERKEGCCLCHWSTTNTLSCR